MIIRLYNPNFNSSFPEIHQVNPALLTNNKVQRLFFKTTKSYVKWCKGKNMVFVMRDPISRFYSCFKDVASAKNVMYQHPSNLDWIMKSKFYENMAFDDFTKNVINIPDYLSDRHFRSQQFYLPEKVYQNLNSLQLYQLNHFMKNAPEALEAAHLNVSNSKIPPEFENKLLANKRFLKRFEKDFVLFDSIQ